MTTPDTGTRQRSPARLVRLALHPTVLLNIVAPLVTYQVLHGQGVTDVVALSIAAVFPLAAVAVSAVQSRRLDLVGALSVAMIALGLLGGLVFQDPHLLLAKDSAGTAALGLAFLGSLARRRPLMFVLGRQFVGRTDPAAGERWAARWATSPDFRHRCRWMTIVWGLALTGEAGLRITLAFLIPPPVLVTISPLLAVAVLGSLAAWSLHRRKTSS